MKKVLTALAMLVCLLPTSSNASVFDESGAFVIARSVKLGDTTISSFSPKTSETAQKTCAPGDPTCSGGKHCDSAAECANGEYCTTVHVCKPLCEKNITLDKVKCSGETPVCTASNHKSYCACTDDSCPNAYKCAESGKSASCSACSKDEECGCPAGTVSNGGGQCVTCNFDTKCADDQYCANAGTASSACQTVSCGADEYAANHTCNSCSGAISNCAECNNPNTCLACQPGYDLVNGKCELHDCGQGQYLNMDDGQCYSCSNGCKSCTDEDSCTACEVAYNLDSGYCIAKTCSEGLYLNSATGECLSCPSTCTACSTVMSSAETSQCTKCAEGYALDSSTGECRPLNCSDSEYVKGNECLPCSGALSNCLTCSGANTCTTCANGYTLKNGQCVGIDCAAGSYLNTSKNPASCDSCSSPCATCSGSATSCSSCVSGYKLSGSTCVQKSCTEMGYLNECPAGYINYPVTIGSNTCATCKKPGDYCASNSECTGAYEKCVNYKCVKKSCSEIGSALKTSCSAGYNAVDAHVSGSDGKCYECRKIDGYCSSNSDCPDSTYKCSNNSCVEKSCEEMGYLTSCPAGYIDYGAVLGSNRCRNCKKPGDYCSSNSDCDSTQKCVSYRCQSKSCSEMGYSTSCSSGYTASSTGITGSDGACVTCPAAACPSGYSTSTTSCGSGYTLETSGTSAGKACGKCVASSCPSGYTAGLTCGTGYTAETNGKSGSQNCVKCTAAPCTATGNYKNLGTTRPSCSTLSEWYVKAVGQSGNATCYACVCDGSTFGGGGCCSGGKVTCGGTEGPCVECCNDSGCSGGKKCVSGSCVTPSCPSGYSTSVTSCSSGYKLETNGSSAGKACGKCVQKSCSEMGYSTSCPSGYVAKTYGSSGSNWTWKTSGSDGTCYDCVKKSTSSSSSGSSGSNSGSNSGSSSSSSGGCSFESGYTCINGVKTACNSGCNSCATDLKCLSCKSGYTMISGSVCR